MILLPVLLVLVPGGTFKPLFQDKGEDKVTVASLYVDQTPVTNEQFLDFVKLNPQWARSKAPSVLADSTYLQHWIGDLLISSGQAQYPVVQVSWHAAKAYCRSQGKRLPTIFEWEYLSDAGNPQHESETLKWYAKGQDQFGAVGAGTPNKFGIKDTSGLIWEWVADFQSAIMSGDSRGGSNRDMFCGGAALKSKDPKRYAAFMRYALRASLKAQYTTSSLGFRCVKEYTQEKK